MTDNKLRKSLHSKCWLVMCRCSRGSAGSADARCSPRELRVRQASSGFPSNVCAPGSQRTVSILVRGPSRRAVLSSIALAKEGDLAEAGTGLDDGSEALDEEGSSLPIGSSWS